MNVHRTKTVSINFEKCSNHEFLLPQLKSLQDGRNLPQKTVAWSYDMEGHAKKCVERYCELAKQKDGSSVHRFNALLG